MVESAIEKADYVMRINSVTRLCHYASQKKRDLEDHFGLILT